MLKLWEKLDAFKTSLELSKGKPEFTVSDDTRTRPCNPVSGSLFCEKPLRPIFLTVPTPTPLFSCNLYPLY